MSENRTARIALLNDKDARLSPAPHIYAEHIHTSSLRKTFCEIPGSLFQVVLYVWKKLACHATHEVRLAEKKSSATAINPG